MIPDTAHPMSADQTGQVISAILDGMPAEPAAAALAAWTRRGETAAEVAAVVRTLLARAAPAATAPAGGVLDLCGTGGSGRDRFNVSTCAAFVCAASGIPVAKHGNRGTKKPNGSFDLLDALGVPFDHGADGQRAQLATHGIAFLFARKCHPGVAAAAPARKLAAAQVPRTVFNLAGPLANPLRPRVQIVGVADPQLGPVMAEAAHLLGADALVVRGEPGLDELTIAGANDLWWWQDGRVQHRRSDTWRRAGIDPAELDGGDAAANAKLCRALLAGSGPAPLRDLVAANAGAAIDRWHGRFPTPDGDGVTQALAVLSDGQAGRLLDRMSATR